MIIVGACQKDFEIAKPNAGTEAMPPGIIELSFEAETLTIPTLQNADKASSLEKIQAMPFAERSKIQMSAYEDGTTVWSMEKLKPKHDLSVQHQTPPSDQPEVKFTRIDRAGMGSFYDSKDVFLFKHQVQIPSFTEIVANIKENPHAIFSILGVKTAENVKLLLAKAKAKGNIVQDLGNGMVSMRSGNGKAAGNVRQSGEANNYTTVDIYNINLGISIGSTLYDNQQNIVCQTFYSYTQNADQRLVPQAIYMQSWDKDPVTGEKRKTETNTYFENVTATININ